MPKTDPSVEMHSVRVLIVCPFGVIFTHTSTEKAEPQSLMGFVRAEDIVKWEQNGRRDTAEVLCT